MNYGSPVMPVNSNSASANSDRSGSAVLSEEINSEVEQAIYGGKRNKSMIISNLLISTNMHRSIS